MPLVSFNCYDQKPENNEERTNKKCRGKWWLRPLEDWCGKIATVSSATNYIYIYIHAKFLSIPPPYYSVATKLEGFYLIIRFACFVLVYENEKEIIILWPKIGSVG